MTSRWAQKTTGRVSNDSDETPGESTLDREAMDSAKRAQERQHQNEKHELQQHHLLEIAAFSAPLNFPQAGVDK